MRRINSSVKVDFISEKGIDNVDRTYFAYVPLENMVCYAVAESYDGDNDINSAKIAVESVLVAFERNPSFRNINRYIQYAHDQIVANSVKNKLETAITVVVSDYTRIRYASCGNIKFYLLSDNAFYLKGETQTYYQFAAREYGTENAPFSENKNLLQYLGKLNRPRPRVSKKTDLPEGSTMLFTTCNLWERVDDVEILDVYEESEPDEFLSNLHELYLFTQLKNPVIRSYSMASMYVEKTYKEDTAKKKKQQRIILLIIIVAIILTIIAIVVVSAIRAGDRRAIAEIERLDNEGIRYSNLGNYSKAYEQYDEARELTQKLRNNWQYTKAKSALRNTVAERWHLFDRIMAGDEYLRNVEYHNALEAYQDAQNAYHEIYEKTESHTGLLAPEILIDKLKLVKRYIEAYDLINRGKMYETEEMFQEALADYREAEDIARDIGDLTLRQELLTLIFEADRKLNSLVEVNFVRQIRGLMDSAERDLDFELALRYCEFIVDIYKDLEITDNQSQEDIIRIEGKIEMDNNAADYIRKAIEAEMDSRFEDALRSYETVLELYREMGMNVRHESYRNITEEIVRIESIVQREAANVIEDVNESEDVIEGEAEDTDG